MRNISFAEKEFYHIYNRGVDKRPIFLEKEDFDRFIKGIEKFNTLEIVGNLDRGHRVSTDEKIVKILAYCINQNHFHLIIEQLQEKGIEKFMHKLCMGYSKYFNTKHRRSGSLFEGRFKAKLLDSNEYLLHLSAYVNLNHIAHSRGHRVSTENEQELARTSWKEYLGEVSQESSLCDTSIILDQFKSREEYRKFAEESLKSVIERKILMEELEDAGIAPIFTV